MGSTKKLLECPFTWGMDHMIENIEDDYEASVDKTEQPILAFIHDLHDVFTCVKREKLGPAKISLQSATENLESMCNKYLKREHISRKVLEHVLQASRYHYCKAAKLESEAVEALNAAPDLEQLRRKCQRDEDEEGKDIEESLNGCKGLAWSEFFEAGMKEAIRYLERAVLGAPECAVWHFVLGKNLRRQRRHGEYGHQVASKESRHLQKAYDLDPKCPLYGVFCAQLYRENRNFPKAMEVYKRLYDAKIPNTKVRLRLALAFIHAKKFDWAKECLDYVQTVSPAGNSFLHYKGIYYEKTRNFELAEKYLEKAALVGNLTADFQLADLRFKKSPSYDYIGHLETIMEKYKNRSYVVQQTALKIAMQYYYNKNNLKKAASFIKKAIEVDPNSKQLLDYNDFVLNQRNINIHDFLRDKLYPELKQTYPTVSKDMDDIIKAIEKL